MARSSYIYVVLDHYMRQHLIVAFTVKYELEE